MIIHDQAIFDAIAAATDHNDDGIFINVQTFIDTFNNHRDRKLCTSLDVAQAPMRPTEAMLNAARDWSYKKYGKPIGNDAAIGCWQAMHDAAQAPPDQFMDDYKRDTTNAMAARIKELEAALREIDNMAPATCEVTLAHQMADIASAALASPVRRQS